MISRGCHGRMGFKARLWLSGGTVWRWRGRRKEWRWVVGTRRPLGQAGGRVGVVLHTSGTVDAGGRAPVVLVNVPGVTAAIVIEAPPIQAVQIRGRLGAGELLQWGKPGVPLFCSRHSIWHAQLRGCSCHWEQPHAPHILRKAHPFLRCPRQHVSRPQLTQISGCTACIHTAHLAPLGNQPQALSPFQKDHFCMFFE